MGEGAASEAVVSRPALPFRVSWAVGLAAGAILVLALVLRILGARGELWLDELWSFRLIDEVKARHDLLWGLAVDNNHYLNTLYLYLVGADAPVLVQRGLSILLGTITVAAAGLAVRSATAVGPLAAMALFAVSYPMVNYGSEARGYAGLILMTLLAFLLVERAAAGSTSARRRLGLVNLLGVAFQPIMLGGIVGEIAWAAWMRLPAGKLTPRGVLGTIGPTARTFSWTVRLLIPFVAIIAFAVLHAEGYRIAGTIPFTVQGFVEGYGGLLLLLLGLPEAVPAWLALILAAAAMGAAGALLFKTDRTRLALYLIFLVGLPLAMFVVRLPNIHFPRYYLASGIVFILLLSEIFAWAWQRGGVLRAVASALLLAILAGNGAEDARLIQDGRDQTAAVMQMVNQSASGSGPVLITSDQDQRHKPIVEFFSRRLNMQLTYVPTAEICAKQPEWLISSSINDEMPEAFDTSVVGCKKVYIKQASFPHWGLSGLPWVVYRAAK